MGIARRSLLLSAFPVVALARQKPKPPLPPLQRGEFVRFADRLTENVVVRLTTPTYRSLLADRNNRCVSSREGFLVAASDRDGRLAPYRINLRSGAVSVLAHPQALSPRTLCLDSKERELWFVDGRVLCAAGLSPGKQRTVLENVDEFHLNGKANSLVVRQGTAIGFVPKAGAAVQRLASESSTKGWVNAVGDACCFLAGDADARELWVAPLGGAKPRRLAAGPLSQPCWRPDGQTVLYLKQILKNNYAAVELWEAPVSGGVERLVAPTSQFATFTANEDGSVLVGAGRSRAQPHLILLLRETRREMVLCEHRDRDALETEPRFSPNSQRVYFESDREGKPAIYSVNVERLIEPTADDNS